MNCYSSYIICGIDRLGKDTLISNINKLGFYHNIIYGKPKALKIYNYEPKKYQFVGFDNGMLLLKSKAKLVFNRSWIGEAVYADLYRGYSGNYVFEMEKLHKLEECKHVKLILLTEAFSKSKHFISDGQSFDDNKRQQEQDRFLKAVDKSILPNKQIICVTAEDGNFRAQEDILDEVLK